MTELVIVMAIVGILAAIAIPVVRGYLLRARLSEAVSNIQGIIAAEQAFFARNQTFTPDLVLCPPNGAPPVGFAGGAARNGLTINWPANPDAVCPPVAAGAAGWNALGWRPEGPLYFQYQVFSVVGNGSQWLHPNNHAALNGVAGGGNTYGIAWNTELGAPAPSPPVRPWVAVQAQADTDGDGNFVFIRGNSYNMKTFRFPDPDNTPAAATW
ncbi:MAG: hypothetical protein GYA21_17785 [Myxococcales bacterium]|nr:hypothetical protein [Myxococcales bacterium]